MAAAKKNKKAEISSGLWGARAEDWANIQEKGYDRLYRRVFEKVGLNKETIYLDAGCGSGVAAGIASEKGVSATGIDAAANLLGIARRRVPAGSFKICDLENLCFKDACFDLVTGFNSFQYAKNPGTALREAKRVTKKGGRVVIVTWGEPQGMEFSSLLSALKTLLPPSPGKGGPFALSDKKALCDFASKAGLEPLDIFDIDCPRIYPDLSTALRGMGSGANAVLAAEIVGEEKVNKAYTKALKPFCRPDGSYKIGAVFRCLVSGA